jgi:hypothetical protein
MIAKRILPSSWLRDGQPSTTLLHTYSKGFDRDQMNKIAHSDYLMAFEMQPKPNHSYIHLITTGAGEKYGPNSNGDYFNKTASLFKAANGKTRMLDGGLDKHHKSFMKYGGVYREHYNSKKGATSLGNIVAEAVNPVMDRGELIIELDNQKWASSIAKMANGEPLTFSMGCGVPYDICSSCLHTAPTRAQYCEHLKYAMLQLDNNYNQIFAINDKPAFHDISEVGTPADRIAHGLRKVAKAGSTTDYEDAKMGLYLPVDLMNKIASNTESKRYALIHKLAEIEKRIEMEGLAPVEETIAEATPCDPKMDDSRLVENAKCHDLNKFLCALSQNGVMLPPKTFIRIVTGKSDSENPGIDELPDAVKGIFSHIVENGDLEEMLQDGSYYPSHTHPDRSTIDLGKSLAEQFSLEDDPLKSRVVKLTITRSGPRPLTKIAARCRPNVSAEASLLATEYAKYQLSFLANSTNDTLTNRIVYHNCS